VALLGSVAVVVVRLMVGHLRLKAARKLGIDQIPVMSESLLRIIKSHTLFSKNDVAILFLLLIELKSRR
jgi:hypothetical protein